MAAITGIIAFTPGTAALASEVNSNFGKIVSEVNGNLNAANLADGAVTNPKIAAGIDAVKLGAGNISNTELGYLDGVTSPIQTQLNARVPTSRTITAGTGLTGGGDLSANRTLSIPEGGIETFHLLDASVTDAKIESLDAGKIASGTLPIARIGNGTVTGAKLHVNAVSERLATINGTLSTQSVASGGNFVLPVGMYLLRGETSLLEIQVNTATVGWVTVERPSIVSGNYWARVGVWSDGTNVRVFNTGGSATTLAYRRLL